jgi:hypothetical protein
MNRPFSACVAAVAIVGFVAGVSATGCKICECPGYLPWDIPVGAYRITEVSTDPPTADTGVEPIAVYVDDTSMVDVSTSSVTITLGVEGYGTVIVRYCIDPGEAATGKESC